MTKAQIRSMIIGLLLVGLLTACGGGGGAVGGFRPVTEAIASTTITREVRFFDQGAVGKPYTFSLTVPEAWVNSFTTTSNGSVVTFNYITPQGRTAPIFTIHALSVSQFWKQNGNEPTQYVNIKSTPDTYFIYNLPVDAFYSGLPKDEYNAFKALVPQVISTFRLQ